MFAAKYVNCVFKKSVHANYLRGSVIKRPAGSTTSTTSGQTYPLGDYE